MSSDKWPWTREEEAKWAEELRQEEFGWMEELVEHMVKDRLRSPSYDPLHLQDEWADEEELAA
jgi:hypothetical protein